MAADLRQISESRDRMLNSLLTRGKAYIIITTVFIVLLGSIFFWYQSSVTKAINAGAERDLLTYTTESAVDVNLRIKSAFDSMEAVADFAATYPDLHSSGLIATLSRALKDKPPTCAVIADTKGTSDTDALHTSHIYIGNLPFFNKAMSGIRSLSGPFKSPHTLKNELVFAVPIKRADSKVRGVLCTYFSRKDFERLVALKIPAGGGAVCIVDEKGNILAAAADKDSEAHFFKDNIFSRELIAKIKKAEAGDENIFKKLSDNKSGCTVFLYNGERHYLYKTTLGFNGWTLLALMPAATLYSSFDIFSSIAFHFGLLIFALSLGAAVVVFYLMNDQIRITSVAKESLKTLTSNIPGGVSCCLMDLPAVTVTEISDGYLDLLECTREEFKTIYKDSFIETVLPDDRERVIKELTNAHYEDAKTVLLEYRVITAKGGVKWVADRSRKGIDLHGRACYYSVIVDNTQAKMNADALALSEERYRVVTEAADEFLFDWNVANDDVFFSPSYCKRFGNRRIYQILHPDDMEAYSSMLDRILAGASVMQSADLRVCDKAGNYIWCRAQGAGIADSNGKVQRVVGILKDISKQVQEHEMLLNMAQRDSLTNLYDKGTTNSLISDFLEGSPKNAHHAILICDIDNFKHVNDTFGHINGDKVLELIAASMQKVFRSTDVVGRIGGDEFMVLMKDIPSEKVLKRKGEELRAALCQSFDFLQGFTTTGSVGSAEYPADGTSLDELYRSADLALYSAKHAGKNRFVRFSSIKEKPADD